MTINHVLAHFAGIPNHSRQSKGDRISSVPACIFGEALAR
jgi:hypothetical protein